jgi:hypothetical protein
MAHPRENVAAEDLADDEIDRREQRLNEGRIEQVFDHLVASKTAATKWLL